MPQSVPKALSGGAVGDGAAARAPSCAGARGRAGRGASALLLALLPALLAALLAAALLAGAPGPSHAAPARSAGCDVPPPSPGTPARVGAVTPDGSLELEDGRRLVPERIVVPTRLEPVPGLAQAAARAAKVAVGGRDIEVMGAAVDRHGRLTAPARLVDPVDGRSDLAAALVAAGAAYAAAEDPCAAPLRAVEAEARQARRGLWAQKGALATAGDEDEMGRRRGLHTVAEGSILSVGVRRDRTYLNFGETWRRDFTVMMRTSDFATIFGHGQDPAMLRGAVVRVRGVVREQGGPAIMLKSQADIERLKDRTGSEESR